MDEFNNDATKTIIASNLNYLIKESGKSIFKISKEIGIAHSHLYAITNPHSKKQPSFEMLNKLAGYFKIEVSDLLKKRE